MGKNRTVQAERSAASEAEEQLGLQAGPSEPPDIAMTRIVCGRGFEHWYFWAATTAKSWLAGQLVLDLRGKGIKSLVNALAMVAAIIPERGH